ncbi:amino acid adenylation domain-containing protein [Micromonospora sp. NPDC000663]|uniref:non-ribosomal peptide synthetase n=1 Tax=Micromonospora sp. NPDC000663 TaxID=3364218 RepID=UPI00368142F1
MTSTSEPSFGQERIWLLEQLLPDTLMHHLTLAYEIRGPLDPAVLGRAADAVVRRHAALRTTFHDRDGRPFVTVHDTAPPVLRVVPLASFDEWADLAEAEIGARFDISELPLLRMTVFRIAEDHHVLLIVLHHIVADGASLGVLLDELSEAYVALRDGEPWRPAELPTTYQRHVEEQRATAADGSWAEDLAYWRERLHDAPAIFTMPGAAPRPSRPTLSSHKAQASLTDEDAAALREFARRQRVSPAMVLSAAWVATLSRHSGERDILIGTSVSGRDRAELRGLIGLFMDVVTLRVQLPTGTSFADLVTRVRDETLTAMMHRRPPFTAVVAELGGERSLAYNPVYQVLFNNASRPSEAFDDVPELVCRRLPLASGTIQTDLEMVVAPGADQRTYLKLEVSADLYAENMPALLLDHMVNLLRDGMAAPDTPVERLSLMNEEQRADLLRLCAPPSTPLPDVRSVLELVRASIDRRPDAPAIHSGSRRFTYAELGRHVGRLADRLARQGVTRGDVVAVHFDRSVEALLAMLASWQLGAAYLPVDPTYPRRRIEFILRDAKAQVIVTGPATAPDTFSALGARVVVVDEVDGDAADAPPLGVPQGGDGEDPAYVIYTSGSTGQPKGVNVPHRAVVNFLTSMARRPGLTQDDVMLALTSPSFDISVLELFLPLTVGARIALASTDDARDPQRLLDLLTEERVTVAQATPVTWDAVLALAPADLRLRVALCGGEALTRPLANRLCAVADEVWNMYGPTETTVWSLIARVRPGPEDEVVPIGRPIQNTSAWVLNADGAVLPAGVVGELHLGGSGVALGYRGRPGLTDQRFVEGPPETGAERLYRTGDLVRLRPDGDFEFLGRADSQVKIRGHRIEVDEIASLLRRHPRVKDAVVVTRDDGSGNTQLLAYVVPAGPRVPAARTNGSR